MTDLELYIPQKLYAKVMHWVNKSSFEVSGFGLVSFDLELGLFCVEDVFLLKQENSSSDTEIDGEALADLVYHTRNSKHHLNWWWHSHVMMDVFWSHTDMDAMRGVSENGWLLSTVFNQKQEMRTAYMEYVPSLLGNKHEYFIDSITTDIGTGLTTKEMSKLDADYKRLVKEPKPMNQIGLFAESNYSRQDFAKHGNGGVYVNGYWYPSREQYEIEREAYERSMADDGAPAIGSNGGGKIQDWDDYSFYKNSGMEDSDIEIIREAERTI